MKDSTPRVLTEWELWACANEMVRQHGFDAPILAGIRADELLECGDFDGVYAWRLIIRRICELIETPNSQSSSSNSKMFN